MGSLKLLRSHRELLGLATVNFLYYMAHQVLPSVYVLYVGYRYGWGERTIGLTLAGVGLATAIVQGGLVRPVVARLGHRRSLLLGLVGGTAGLLLFGLATTPLGVLGRNRRLGDDGILRPVGAGADDAACWGRRNRASCRAPTAASAASRACSGRPCSRSPSPQFIGPERSWHLPGAPFLLAAAFLVAGMLVAIRTTRPEHDAPGVAEAA